MSQAKRHTIRKMYSLTEEDIELIKLIKKKSLKKQSYLTDSLIIRLGIRLVSQLSESKLVSLSSQIPRPLVGRPSSMQ